jgi:hypothetical protein
VGVTPKSQKSALIRKLARVIRFSGFKGSVRDVLRLVSFSIESKLQCLLTIQLRGENVEIDLRL